MTSTVDIVIVVFIGINLIRGYISGFSKSFFISVRFIMTFLIARFIFVRFSQYILDSGVYLRYKEFTEDILLKVISPYVYFALNMDNKVKPKTLLSILSAK